MKARTFMAVMLFFATILFVMSCSDSKGAESGESEFSVSATSAVPGEYVTFTHDSFKVGTPVSVSISDTQNYSLKYEVYPSVDGDLQVPLPVYVDVDTKRIIAGNVSVALSGVNRTKPLYIAKPIAIVYETGDKPGDLLIEWFKQNRLNYEETLANISSFDADTRATVELLNIEIEKIDDLIAEFEATDTFTLYFNDGVSSHTFTKQELRDADAIIYTSSLGMLAAYKENLTGVATQKSTDFETLTDLLDSASATKNAALEKVKELRKQIPQIMSNIEGKSTLLVGGITLVTDVAVVIGGLAAGTYAVVTGVHSEGLAWMSSKIDNGSLSANDYEFGAELADKTVDAAASFAFSLGSAATKIRGGIAELAYTAWNMFTSNIESICSSNEESHPSSLQLLSRSLSEEDQFCREVELTVLYKDSFYFLINIPGYTGTFNKQFVAFGLSTVNDGPPTYPFVAAFSTTVDFDPLRDDVVALMLNISLAPGSYLVYDESFFDQGGIAELSFTSKEILEDLDSTHKWPVSFTQRSGTLELEYYGTEYGDRLKGNFFMNVEGTIDSCIDSLCEEKSSESVRGTISGTFDGFLKEYQ